LPYNRPDAGGEKEDEMSGAVIDRLEQELWSQCVTQVAATDDETIQRWQLLQD